MNKPFVVNLLSNHDSFNLTALLKKNNIKYQQHPISHLDAIGQDENLIIIDLTQRTSHYSSALHQEAIDKTVLLYVDDDFPIEKTQQYIGISNFLFLRKGLSDEQKITTIFKARYLINKQENSNKNIRILPIFWIARYNKNLQRPELFESPVVLEIHGEGVSFQSYTKFAIGEDMILWIMNNENTIDEYRTKIDWLHHSQKNKKNLESFDYGLKIENKKFKDFYIQNKNFFSSFYL